MNWLEDQLRRGQARVRPVLGEIRNQRRFDPNNYEKVVNDVTGRVTTSQSQRLAVAQGLGLNTSGLIIGGQRDTSQAGPRAAQGGKNQSNTSQKQFKQLTSAQEDAKRQSVGGTKKKPPSNGIPNPPQ